MSFITQEQVELAIELLKDKPQTNGDKWRAMTDEQIAEIIAADGCAQCPAEGIDNKCAYSDKACKAAIVDWLKQEEE